ncbi:YhdP family protein [Parvularcula mediterranea]|nr:AsmA-like C-terminal domain-containing protein [Parvularcula mediterranea]
MVLRAASFSLTAAALGGALVIGSRAPVGAFVPTIETTLSRAADMDVSIEGLALSTSPTAMRLEFEKLSAYGTQRVDALRGEADLSLRGLLRLDPAPKRILVDQIDVETRFAPRQNDEEARPLPVERILTLLSSGVAGEVSLPQVNMTYAPEGVAPIALDGGSLSASSVDDGYRVSAKLPFVLGDGQRTDADVEVRARSNGLTELFFLSDGAPLAPLLAAAGVDVVTLDGEVSGLVSLTVDREGRPVDGSIDLSLDPGTGELVGRPFSFGENQLTAVFEGDTTIFRVMTFDYDVAGNTGELAGTVSAANILSPREIELDFDMRGEAIHLDLGELLEGTLDVDAFEAKGRFDADERRLAFDRLRAAYFESEARGSLALTFPEGFSGNPRIESDAVLPGPLTPQQVLAGWPLNLAREARKWVVENLKAGTLTNLSYKSDIPMNAIQPETALPNETMDFTFEASDATVFYLPGMPKLENVRASARVRGNSFTVDGRRGRVAGVDILSSRLNMPRFTPQGATATFRGRLSGEIATILEALEEASLVDFDEAGYATDQFHGKGIFDLAVDWPLKEFFEEEEVVVRGDGSFALGGIDDVLPGIDASEATGRVSLTPERVVIRGDGLTAGAPATFEWRQSLKQDMRAELAVSTAFDTLTADMVGIPLRQFFRGEIPTQIFADDLRPGAPLKITGELTDAAVNVPPLGLRKPKGIKGFFETTVAIPEPVEDPGDPGLVSLREMRLTSPLFNVEGSGVFTQEGAVVRLELPRLFIEDTANLSLRMVTEGNVLDLDITGDHASAAPAIDSVLGMQPARDGKLPGRLDLDVELSRVSLKNGVELHEVRAEGQHTGDYVEQFTLTARVGDEGRMNMTVDQPEGSELGFVEVEATDFGTLIGGVFGLGSVTGGAGSIKGTTDEKTGFSGRFEVSEILVQDAPLLAKILSFTSLDGAFAQLNGEGIRFTALEGDVTLNEGLITLEGAKLVGSSLGMSAAGEINLDAGTVDVRGAVAPAYALNGLLGSIPGLGRLFVSREGEGIVAFSYTVTGPISQPVVTVNALSALTPGILRRIFDPVEGEDVEGDTSEGP